MRYVDAESVHANLTYFELVKALQKAHTFEIPATDRFKMVSNCGSSVPEKVFLGLAAWQNDSMFGVKLVTSFARNPTQFGIDTVNGVYVLFDGTTGVPVMIIDGKALTHKKTAADSALGSYFLSSLNAENLLMVGCGSMAPHLIRAHLTVRPTIKTIKLWNRTPQKAEALAEVLYTEGIKSEVAHDLKEAASEADIISCATMSTEPLILGDWLKPGVHVDLVGSYTAEMREVDGKAIKRASVFFDSWACTERVGDFVFCINNKEINKSHLKADLFDLCQNKYNYIREKNSITLFKNGGGSHLDLFVAKYIYSKLVN